MNKKGMIQEKIYWIIIEFILVGIFITGSLVYISNMSSSLLYERIYISKTLAMKVSALQATGIINYYYTNPELEKFNIALEQNRIVVQEEKGASNFQLFPRNADINIKTKTLNAPKKIGFEKQDSYLAMVSDVGYLLKERCEDIRGSAKGLMLDPGHGGFDKGIEQDNFIEAETNRQIAFQVLRNSPYVMVDSTRSVSAEEHKTIEQRIGKLQKKDYALVGIQTNPEGDKIKAYISINSDVAQSRKLACEINNALIDVLPDITNALIIPINPEHLAEDDPLKILKAADIGMVIEINYPAIRHDIVGESIKKGIAGYKDG